MQTDCTDGSTWTSVKLSDSTQKDRHCILEPKSQKVLLNWNRVIATSVPW